MERAGNGHSHNHEPLAQMSSNELRREIEHTREDLEHTIDELKHVASPEEILRTVTNLMRGGPGRFLRNFGYTVRDNPLPVTLTAVGLIWLAASEGHGEGEVREESWYGEGVGRGRAHGQGASDVGERVREVGQRVREGVGEVGERARERVEDVREKARDVKTKASQTLHQQAEENPLLLAALGVAIGAALGGALPRTRIEDRTIGPVGERARRRVRQVVGERGAEVGSSMGRVVERAKEAIAPERGSDS
jgi:ElaB/YqjD/DUF883 family membrane-anchored ribosome-binding protein